MKRESDRIGGLIEKAYRLRAAAGPRHAKAQADLETAKAEGDGIAVADARRRLEAEEIVIQAQDERVASLGCEHANAVRLEANADFDRYCEGLERREARQAATLERDFAKAFAPAIALLIARAGDAAEVAEANAQRAARHLPPILTADERARSTPGRIEAEICEDRVVWRKHQNGPEVTVFGRNKRGELVPAEGGAVRSIERVRVQEERHIAPQRPKPLTEAVVIPGFAAGAPPLWPTREVR